jgi:hypothetical protein
MKANTTAKQKIDNGGPAFPVPEVYEQAGMTLRDYFATHASDADVAMALYDLGVSGGLSHCNSGISRLCAARLACADAMIAERARGDGPY